MTPSEFDNNNSKCHDILDSLGLPNRDVDQRHYSLVERLARLKPSLVNEMQQVIPTDSREGLLRAAIRCVTKDRNATHGDPEDNFNTIASFWTVWLRAIGLLKASQCISPIDVAVMMDLMKTSRLVTSPTHPDHWIDKAGYAACGGEIALKNAKNED
jgi:hypothetical protein